MANKLLGLKSSNMFNKQNSSSNVNLSFLVTLELNPIYHASQDCSNWPIIMSKIQILFKLKDPSCQFLSFLMDFISHYEPGVNSNGQ